MSSSSPLAADEIDAEAARDELGTHGLPAGDPDRRRHLTDAGRAAQQQA